ncbi:hypothetical protein AVEN_174514-1 [Araneus ventricosus]|uniref:Uncharacterized protein n=1 Tax=Araneus ventricosus TaxID=182803 RepID=A0A4Y2T269_ARAVE|nr:hypothetical protein AVEN_174514-1 [Araneus ventricosus]
MELHTKLSALTPGQRMNCIQRHLAPQHAQRLDLYTKGSALAAWVNRMELYSKPNRGLNVWNMYANSSALQRSQRMELYVNHLTLAAWSTYGTATKLPSLAAWSTVEETIPAAW